MLPLKAAATLAMGSRGGKGEGMAGGDASLGEGTTGEGGCLQKAFPRSPEDGTGAD